MDDSDTGGENMTDEADLPYTCKVCGARFWAKTPKDLCYSCAYQQLRASLEEIFDLAAEGLKREYIKEYWSRIESTST